VRTLLEARKHRNAKTRNTHHSAKFMGLFTNASNAQLHRTNIACGIDDIRPNEYLCSLYLSNKVELNPWQCSPQRLGPTYPPPAK
jgi:hypothetical protein